MPRVIIHCTQHFLAMCFLGERNWQANTGVRFYDCRVLFGVNPAMKCELVMDHMKAFDSVHFARGNCTICSSILLVIYNVLTYHSLPLNVKRAIWVRWIWHESAGHTHTNERTPDRPCLNSSEGRWHLMKGVRTIVTVIYQFPRLALVPRHDHILPSNCWDQTHTWEFYWRRS